jgi:hypothetical protein
MVPVTVARQTTAECGHVETGRARLTRVDILIGIRGNPRAYRQVLLVLRAADGIALFLGLRLPGLRGNVRALGMHRACDVRGVRGVCSVDQPRRLSWGPRPPRPCKTISIG